jgi:hypothetical protein
MLKCNSDLAFQTEEEMGKSKLYILTFLIVLFFGSGIMLWANNPGKELPNSGKSYFIPRDQVLLEIVTGTW